MLVAELVVAQSLGQFGGVGGLDEVQVVDPGRRGGWGVDVGAGFAVDVAADPVRDRGSHGPALVAHGDVGEVERVEHQLDAVPDQGGVDFVGVGVQGHGRGLGHGALLGPQERLVQGVTGGQHRWAGCEPTLQRRLPGLAVRAAVVDLLDPGGEQAVQLGQAGDRAAGALGTVDDLDEELFAL